MPRLKRVSKSQQREKKKVQKRGAKEESKDKEGLIFPRKSLNQNLNCLLNVVEMG